MINILEKKLKLNGYSHLIDDIKKIKPSEAKLIAKGIEIVYDNWDCAPNGGVLSEIVQHLKTEHDNYIEKCRTFTGTLFFKNNEWFFKWTDLTSCGMRDDDYMYTPIMTENINISEWKNDQTVKCLIKVEKFDSIKAYFKEILK